MTQPENKSHLLPCGCMKTSTGAHRLRCPEFETVFPPDGSWRLEDLNWRPRAQPIANEHASEDGE